MQNYNVLIVGGGISGLMAAYRLRQHNKYISITIIDKGNMIENRKCPATSKQSCKKCKTCAITSGFAGAGAFSDGKFNLGTSYGGTLGEELGDELANKYIRIADTILENFYDGDEYVSTYGVSEALKVKCLQNNLQLLDMITRHLGTENNYAIMSSLIDWLKNNGVNLKANEEVVDIKSSDICSYSVITNKEEYKADTLILATGRSGSELIEYVCEKFNIETESNEVDIGVRVETKDVIWREFSSRIYEPKIICKTKTFEDKTRMFCFNQGGIVSAENNGGIITANGHSFADEARKTDNCNFAILSSIKFTEPFDKPTEYVKSYSQMANIIGAGNVLVQRFGDLVRGRRTTESRLAKNTVKPTLKATAGDISLVLPYRILTNIIETIYALDKVAPGTANDDTLLYGCESKYYSIKPKHDSNFSIRNNLFLIGDGSGICRGLSQSAAMGLYVADKIKEIEVESKCRK